MLTFKLLRAGYCTHPEFIVMRGGRWRSVPIPALCALLKHPDQGPILFDTGYTARFFAETARWPYSLYPRLTPVHIAPTESVAAQLPALGLAPEDIEQLIISHFHADHVAGLRDFPRARFVFFEEAYAAVRYKRGVAALRAGFLPGLLPPDFEQRARPVTVGSALPAACAPFEHGADLFGDGSLLAVRLPGHAHGQMGLFFEAKGLGPMLLAADACWHSRAYQSLRWPHPLANLALANPPAYRNTLTQLHQLHQRRPELHIIPSHCPEAAARYCCRRS